jgi:hypothetical protein
MRYPRASAVIVAMSTFVAIVTISAVASQLAPLDRAGAVLPEGPITIDGQESDAGVDETTPAVEEPATGANPPAGSTENSTGGTATGDATVVVPVPAETVQPEPEPTAEPTTPGNSGTAPGKPDEPGNHNEQSKP